MANEIVKLKNLTALKDTERTRLEASLSVSQMISAHKQGQAVLAFTVLNMVFVSAELVFALPRELFHLL